MLASLLDIIPEFLQTKFSNRIVDKIGWSIELYLIRSIPEPLPAFPYLTFLSDYINEIRKVFKGFM